MTIHLRGLPGSIERATHSLLGLASNGVCQAIRITPHAGALLPHRFTLTCGQFPGPSAVSLCCTIRQVAPTWLSPALCPKKSRLSSTWSSHAAVTRPTPRQVRSLWALADDDDRPIIDHFAGDHRRVACHKLVESLLLRCEPKHLSDLWGRCNLGSP